jgi:PEP-CTERM motif
VGAGTDEEPIRQAHRVASVRAIGADILGPDEHPSDLHDVNGMNTIEMPASASLMAGDAIPYDVAAGGRHIGGTFMTRKLVGPVALAVVLTVFGADSPARADVNLTITDPDRTVALPASGSITVDFDVTITWSNLSQITSIGTGLNNGVPSGDGLYMDSTNVLNYDTNVTTNYLKGLAQVAGNSSGTFTGTALEFTILPTTQPGLYTYQSDLTTLENFFVYAQDATTGDDFYTSENFSITVTGATPPTAVPEPNTLVVAALGILAGGGVAWRRRKRA